MLNRDYNTRDKFLFHGYNEDAYMGGIRRIRCLTSEDIKYLLDLRFIDPMDCQNDSPSVKEIYDFLKEHSEFYAFGYAVSPKRDDYRISIEGICSNWESINIPKEDLIDFVDFSVGADELSITPYCRAWWD